MSRPKIVIDTNVLVAGLRSRRGSSFALLNLIGKNHFDIVLSVPLMMEYEAVLNRPELVPVSTQAVAAVLDFLCSVGICQDIFYLWRPRLRDANDDHVLELAMNANAKTIVTHNVRDFVAAHELGVSVVAPAKFLESLKIVRRKKL